MFRHAGQLNTDAPGGFQGLGSSQDLPSASQRAHLFIPPVQPVALGEKYSLNPSSLFVSSLKKKNQGAVS